MAKKITVEAEKLNQLKACGESLAAHWQKFRMAVPTDLDPLFFKPVTQQLEELAKLLEELGPA